jgi:hypothetical protein
LRLSFGASRHYAIIRFLRFFAIADIRHTAGFISIFSAGFIAAAFATPDDYYAITTRRRRFFAISRFRHFS